MCLIKFQHVSKKFSEQFVLDNFSFEINEGDKVQISGRSGLGKTTLFRLLLGFEQADSGNILFNNNCLENKSYWEFRKTVAYISQDLNIGYGKVRNFFTETLALKSNFHIKSKALAMLDNYLEFFEIPVSFLDKNIEELSGGEKQRIAIINALLLERKIFLLDEISSALDNSLKIKTIDFFLTNPEFTVLYISHDKYLPKGFDIKTIKFDVL